MICSYLSENPNFSSLTANEFKNCTEENRNQISLKAQWIFFLLLTFLIRSNDFEASQRKSVVYFNSLTLINNTRIYFKTQYYLHERLHVDNLSDWNLHSNLFTHTYIDSTASFGVRSTLRIVLSIHFARISKILFGFTAEILRLSFQTLHFTV